MVRIQGDKGSPAPGTGAFGVAIFLVSLSVLFVAGVVAYAIVRSRADAWPPPGTPALPSGVWLSTLFLLLGSGSIHLALLAIRRGDGRSLTGYLILTSGFSLLFTLSQIRNGVQFYVADPGFYENLYGFGFLMLTGLHAAHVLGGILAMAVVTVRAGLGHYNWAYYPGVRHMATYWHFLGVVWLLILAVLLLDR